MNDRIQQQQFPVSMIIAALQLRLDKLRGCLHLLKLSGCVGWLVWAFSFTHFMWKLACYGEINRFIQTCVLTQRHEATRKNKSPNVQPHFLPSFSYHSHSLWISFEYIANCDGENETNCIINGIIEFFINIVAHALIGSDEIELVFLQIAQFKSWFFSNLL